MQGHLENSGRPILCLGGSAVRPRWYRQQTVTFGAWQGLYGVGEKAVKPRWQVPGARCPVSGTGCRVPGSGVRRAANRLELPTIQALTGNESLSWYGRTSFWSGESRPQ
jgi:hypothetical protein